MNSISFNNIVRSERKISFTILEQTEKIEEQYDIFFEFNIDNSPSDYALSMAFCCLVGSKNYDKIYFDLNLDKNFIERISCFTKSVVNCRDNTNIYKNKEIGNDFIINFSGGFDSLALSNILPAESTKLVSIDFGGNFHREANFFTKFNTYIVKTNFRQTNFFKKLEPIVWQFMGIGTALFFEKLNAKYFAFGTIEEADFNLNCNVSRYVQPFSLMGLEHVTITEGLTEIGTAKIVNNQSYNVALDSLNSLSNPGSVKRLRKDLLLRCYREDVPIHAVSNFTFGKDFVFDFLLFYMLKKIGIEYISNYEKNIPEEVINISNSFKLDFYERINPKTFITIPNSEIYNHVIKKLSLCDIDIYSLNDYYEINQISKILSKYYNGKSKNVLLAVNSKQKMSVPNKDTTCLKTKLMKLFGFIPR